jgi:hypothetical protein
MQLVGPNTHLGGTSTTSSLLLERFPYQVRQLRQPLRFLLSLEAVAVHRAAVVVLAV